MGRFVGTIMGSTKSYEKMARNAFMCTCYARFISDLDSTLGSFFAFVLSSNSRFSRYCLPNPRFVYPAALRSQMDIWKLKS